MPLVDTTVTCGMGSPPGRAPAVAASGRAGMPATTTSPAKPAAARASAPVETHPCRMSPRPQANARSSGEPGAGRSRSSRGRAAHTSASADRTATLVANSVVCGAIRSVARSPTHTEYTTRATRPFGIVIGSVIMKKRKIRISGDVTSSHQNDQPVIGPRCHRAVIEWPLAASTPIPTANASQKPPAMTKRRSRDRIDQAPDDDQCDGQREPEGHRPPPEVEWLSTGLAEHQEAEDEPEVRGVEDVAASPADQVLRQERDGGRRREDPRSVKAPPVPVRRPRHTQDERDSVAGEERARRPHDHVLAEEGNADLKQGARSDRDEDLGYREAEPERGLSENLQRDDHRREVEARVAQLREQNRVRRAADREHQAAAGGGCSMSGHRLKILGRRKNSNLAP